MGQHPLSNNDGGCVIYIAKETCSGHYPINTALGLQCQQFNWPAREKYSKGTVMPRDMIKSVLPGHTLDSRNSLNLSSVNRRVLSLEI